MKIEHWIMLFVWTVLVYFAGFLHGWNSRGDDEAEKREEQCT